MKHKIINALLWCFFAALVILAPVWMPLVLIFLGFTPIKVRHDWDRKANAASGLK